MAKRQPSSAGRAIRGFFKWFFMILGTLFLIGLTTGAIMACYGAHYIQTVIIPQAQEEVATKMTMIRADTSLTSSIFYYDTSTNSYQVEETLYGEENRSWITYDEIPERMVNATIAIEDKRFREHHGVDWIRTAAGALYRLTGQRQEGGSTITQQLIKNVTGNKENTVERKILEIFEALEFDATHTKEETMEWYLNIIFLGHNCYGISSAAEYYFGKEVADLTLAECASLISITNNPSKYDPYRFDGENNLKRRNTVLEQMVEQGFISEAEKNAAAAEPLNLVDHSAAAETEDETSASAGDYYTWYTDTVIREVISDLMETYDLQYEIAEQMIYSGGLQIYSCLDPSVQAVVDDVYVSGDLLAGHRSSYRGQELQSAITVVDNDTGAVVAIAGGVGEKEGSRIWSYATQTLRPPGSSLKPLSVYAPALELGMVTPDSLIEDSPIRLSDGTLFPGRNAGRKPTGDMVTVRYGLQESLNTVAVQLLQRVSPQVSFDFLRERFGITTLVEDYTGPSGKHYSDIDLSPLSLGSLTNGVSTYEMAAAYATFARDGMYVNPYVYTVVTNSEGQVVLAQEGYDISFDANGAPTITGYAESEAVLKESTVTDMDEMLTNNVERGVAEKAAIDGVKVSGKTGTTNDDYDRWFAGYIEDYTAVVWTGYDSAETINYDGNPSVDMWRTVMEQLAS